MKKAILPIILVCSLTGCVWIKTRILERKEETVTVYTYDAETMIDKPVEEVFEHLMDWELMSRLLPYIDFDLPPEPRIRGVGDYLNGRANALGLNFPVRLVVVQLEPGRIFRIAVAEDVRGSFKFTLEPVENRTRFIMSAHIFMLPDSLLTSAFNSLTGQESLVRNLGEEFLTNALLKLKAQLEAKDLKSVRLDKEPTSDVFVDAYFTAEENFSLPPEELFNMFASVDGMNSVLPAAKVEPIGDSPMTFEGVGNHYIFTTTRSFETPLVGDMVIMHFDSPEECRLFLYAHEVCIEMDFLVAPTISGSKVFFLFIVDLPDTMAGRALDVIMITSSIDKRVQEALSKAKSLAENL